MQFVVVRRNVRSGAAGLAAAAALAGGTHDGASAHDVRWIRSQVRRETSGTLTLTCIYQGCSAEAVREYLTHAGQPPDEVLPVPDRRGVARGGTFARARAA